MTARTETDPAPGGFGNSPASTWLARSGCIAIRATSETDLDMVLQIERDPENTAFIAQWPRGRHRDAIHDPAIAHWLVLAEPDWRVVGYLILLGLANPHRNLELTRIVIAEKNRGYGRKVLRLVKLEAFERFRAHRLWLDVMEHNHRARHLYRSEGFVEEATLRKTVKIDDRFVSLIVLSILEHEYRSESKA